MEKLIFILFIAGANAIPRRDPNPIPGYVCPPEDIATGCRGPKDCLYPNPADCHSFIQCTAAGLAYVMPCAPNNLVYNDTQKQCDWPHNTQCVVFSTTATPTQSSTKTSTSPPSSGDFICPRDEIANTGCKGPKDCLYPNPANCSSFIQCVPQPDGSGKPEVMPCPAGLEWNDNKKECDWPPSPTCPKTSPVVTTTTTKAPTTEAKTSPPTTPVCEDDSLEDNDLDLPTLCSGCSKKRLIANPNSQHKYIECNGGENGNQNSVRKCSPGLLFDSNKLTCDYAGLVNPRGY